MGSFDQWMLRTAGTEIGSWCAGTGADMPLLIRLAPRLAGRCNLAGTLAGIVSGVGVAPHRVLLGVDEALLAANPDWIAAVLQPLRNKGFGLALTGFGAGGASLSTMQCVPWDLITIAHSRIAGLGQDAETDAMVRAILQAGRTLGRRMAAEGVKTTQQHAFLAAEGCDQAEGELFSAPMSGTDFTSLLARRD